MHNTVTDNDPATFIDPMGIYGKVLVTTDPVVCGRGDVQSQFSANPTFDFWLILAKIGQLILDMSSVTHHAATDNSAAKFTDPVGIYGKVQVITGSVVRGMGDVQSHFSANPAIYFWVHFGQKSPVSSQVKSSLYSPIYKEHKAKIKCAIAAGAGKMPELLRTEVQLGRGNHHPTGVHGLFTKLVAAPRAPKCLKIRSLGREPKVFLP